MNLFDSHCHYNDEKFDEDRDEIIKKNLKEISNAIVSGYNIESSEKAVEIANEFSELYAIVGISPNDVEDCQGDVFSGNLKFAKKHVPLAKIEELAQNPKVVGIGEIGLDYYWNTDNKELQKEVFIKQIELANKLDLPIVIHTREAVMDTIEILKKNPVNKKGVFHFCPMNVELIKEAVKLGFYISFSGNITFKNAKNAEKCIKEVPIDKQLIETDSPYMTPEPYRGKRNDPRKGIICCTKSSRNTWDFSRTSSKPNL